MDLGSFSSYWARWRPDGVALRYLGRDVTWSEFDRETASLAGGLIEAGVTAGDRIGIFGHNSVEWCELAIAALKLGAVVVPVNVRLSPPEVRYVVGHAGCRLVAYDAELGPSTYAPIAPDLPGVTTVALDGTGADLPLADLRRSPVRPEPMSPDAPAVLAYTSGTTGHPKGAVLTHGNLVAGIVQRAFSDGWTSQVRTLLCVPLAYTAGIVSNFLPTYGVGGTFVLERAFDPARVLEILVHEPISAFMGVPVLWEAIAAEPGFAAADLSALTTAITGGASVAETLLRTYQAKGVLIRQAYALTEASGSVCLLPAERALAKPRAAGMPNLHTSLRLVDDAGCDVAAGEVGEILVRGPQVMAGYWNDEAATAATLQGGWLHTGDLGRFDEEGLLEVVDRKKDMLISGGLNVYPVEVDRVVAQFPGVIEAASFGVPDPKWGETVATVVVGPGVDPDALRVHCREHLADYKVPRHVLLVSEPLPRNTSGKVLRRQLRAQWERQHAPEKPDGTMIPVPAGENA